MMMEVRSNHAGVLESFLEELLDEVQAELAISRVRAVSECRT